MSLLMVGLHVGYLAFLSPPYHINRQAAPSSDRRLRTSRALDPAIPLTCVVRFRYGARVGSCGLLMRRTAGMSLTGVLGFTKRRDVGPHLVAGPL